MRREAERLPYKGFLCFDNGQKDSNIRLFHQTKASRNTKNQRTPYQIACRGGVPPPESEGILISFRLLTNKRTITSTHPVRFGPSGTPVPTGWCEQGAKIALLIHRFAVPLPRWGRLSVRIRLWENGRNESRKPNDNVPHIPSACHPEQARSARRSFAG